jgi:aminotransferase
MAYGVPVPVNTRIEDHFALRASDVEKAITPKTKVIALNFPTNPTGAIEPPEELEKIAQLCVKHDLLCFTDEIYSELLYDSRHHKSIVEFPGMRERTVLLHGFSKAFAMTGWRVGYLIAPRAFMPALTAMHGNFFISTNEFVQWAALAALREAQDESARFRRIFDERRRAMVGGLRDIGLGVGAPPTGAFYVLANARRFTSDSLAFAFEILDRAHVGVTPGADFGRNAEGYLRFSYAQSLERIQEAMVRIGRFLSDRR